MGPASPLRRSVTARTPFAESASHPDCAADAPRPAAARRIATLARLVLVPFAALAAAGAGAVFLVLLPICGIASAAEGLARVCWDAARDGIPRPTRGAASHG